MGNTQHFLDNYWRTPILYGLWSRNRVTRRYWTTFHRQIHFEEIFNERLRRDDLDLLQERRDNAQEKLECYQQKMAHYYNKNVKSPSFRVGDLVLRKVFLSSQEPSVGTQGPNWEGLYRVTAEVVPGTYRIEDLFGKPIPHPWNTEHLCRYYQ
ncbi:Ribonuclease H [Abeliophyllum distichum]|uniref:Ribonuclease H n=1 Tax=Abeliophyllum distichum TaxID=126358 RepID=A0ABD1QW36_9LAMI